MRTTAKLCGFAGAVVALLATACASSGDKPPLMSISHRATVPDGSLSVNQDGRYFFVNSSTSTETHGELSSGDLAEVKARVAAPKLESLYTHRSVTDDDCDKADDGYVLISRLGAACFVVSTISDPSANSDLTFFVTLFNEKSQAK